MGQPMTFLNGGPAQTLTPAFSYSVACKDQAEIDSYWDKLLAGGGKTMACGWLTDKFGLCWQIVPENIGEILKHPSAMAAMMKMVKFDIAALEAAAKE
jgi:predicted 3-demethylubiquinone-9 3-methyltransferase (glyoxalase superfamily)